MIHQVCTRQYDKRKGPVSVHKISRIHAWSEKVALLRFNVDSLP